MNFRRAAFFVALLLPGLWLLAAGFGRDPHAVPTMLVGRPLPAFHAQDLNGVVFDANALAGRPALINFWATWCFPCQAEHALLQHLGQKFRDQMTVVGVIYQDSAEQVRDYLRKHPSTYRNVLDPEAAMAMDFGVAGVPETFFVDAAGKIVYKHAGALTPAVLDKVLTPLLAASTATQIPPRESRP